MKHVTIKDLRVGQDVMCYTDTKYVPGKITHRSPGGHHVHINFGSPTSSTNYTAGEVKKNVFIVTREERDRAEAIVNMYRWLNTEADKLDPERKNTNDVANHLSGASKRLGDAYFLITGESIYARSSR